MPPGSIRETAEALSRAIDVAKQVRGLLERLAREQGRLDLLVNITTLRHENLIDPGPLWVKPLDLVGILGVGLCLAYVASYYAAPPVASRAACRCGLGLPEQGQLHAEMH